MTAGAGDELEALVAALSARVAKELELLDLQIAKSRAARGAAVATLTISLPTAAMTDGKTPDATLPKPTAEQQEKAQAVAMAPPDSSNAAGPSPSANAENSAAQQDRSADAVPQQKCGVLLNFGRPGRMLANFQNTYVVVDSVRGVLWWDTEADFRKNPTKPKDSIPFFEITSNSRASKFKKAMTCWPLVLKEDCAKATDASVWYFGVEYYDPKQQKSQLLALGAKSLEERNAWVQYLTLHVKLFLANREESTEFLDFPVGSATPTHVSAVLDGEAPR